MKSNLVLIFIVTLFSGSSSGETKTYPTNVDSLAALFQTETAFDSVFSLMKENKLVQLYRYIEDNYDTVGVQCSQEACKNLKYAMRNLKSGLKAKRGMTVAEQSEIGRYLGVAKANLAVFKQSAFYKTIVKKTKKAKGEDAFIHFQPPSIDECKLYGDAVWAKYSRSFVYFTQTPTTSTKDASKIVCYYKHRTSVGKDIRTVAMMGADVGRTLAEEK